MSDVCLHLTASSESVKSNGDTGGFMEEAAVFSRFDSYDFAADRRFQDGLKVLQQRPETSGARELEMKLFFYNRFVEPIDGLSYKQRSSASPRVTTPSSGPDSDVSEHLAAAAAAADETPSETETEVTQLSFAEVMRLIQEGKEVPGALKLDIKPSNESATPSQMQRLLKPWESK